MPVQLGSAYGQIVIDGKGVKKGITDSIATIGHLSNTLSFVGSTIDKFVIEPLAAIGKEVVSMAADFQSQMATLSIAASSAGLSFDQLHDAAMTVGSDTALLGVSATGAADAMTGLYKAGLSTTEIFGDLNGYMAGTTELSGALRAAIDLAAATELNMVEASDLAAIALASFGAELESEEERARFVTAAMNNFVQAADASVAEVTGLAEALGSVGPTAAAFGFSLQDTNNALAILSTRGIQGAEAGTALKSMMTNMMRDTPKVKEALADLNVTLYDQEGQMRSLPNIIAQIETAMDGMTEAQRNQYVQTLAGTYGMKSLQTLLAEGTQGWQDMADATANAATIQEQAAAKADTFAGALESVQGVGEALGITFGEGLLPVLTDVLRTVGEVGQQLMPMVASIAQGIGAMASEAFTVLKSFVGSFAQALGIDFNALQANAGGWGSNIVLSLARGMARAIAAVVQVLRALGNVIAGFLRPGSPPKLLPDLDDWGAEAATIYMDGWGQADFGVFDQLSSTISDYLRSMGEDAMPKEQVLPWISTFKAGIAEVVGSLDEMGASGADAINELIDSAGFLPDSMKAYAGALVETQVAQNELNSVMETMEAIADASRSELEALLASAEDLPAPFEDYARALLDVEDVQTDLADSMADLEAASEEVARAQAELNDVTAEYDAILSPLREQMQEIRDRKQDIRDEQRLAAIGEELSDESLSAAERELLMLERREIQLRQQISAVEDEQAAEEDAAQTRLDAAQAVEDAARAEAEARGEAVAAAQEVANAAREAAQAEVDARREVLDVAKEQLDLQKRIIDEQVAANNAMKQQGSILDGLKDSLASVSEELGKAVKGISAAGPALGDAMDEMLAGLGESEFDFDLAGMLLPEETVSDVQSIADEIAAIFGDLGTDVGDLGTQWGGVFASLQGWSTETFGGIGAKVGEFWEVVQPIFSTVVAWLQTNIPLALQSLQSWWMSVWPVVQAVFLTVWTVIQAVIQAVVAVIVNQVWPQLQEAFATLTETMASLGIDWSTVWEAVKQAVVIVAQIIGACLLALVGVVVGVVNGIAALLNSLIQAGMQMKNGWETLLRGLATFIGGIMAIIRGIFTGNMTLIFDGLGAFFGSIIMLGRGALEVFCGLWKAVVGSIVALVQGFVSGIVGFFTSLYESLVGGSIIPDLVNGIITWFTTLWTTVSTIVTTLIAAVQLAWTSFVTAVTTLITTFLAALLTLWTSFRTNLIKIITLLATLMMRAWTTLKARVSILIKGWLDSMKTAWTKFKISLMAIVTGLITKLREAWALLKTKVLNTVTTTWNKLKKIFTTMKTWLSTTLTAALTTIGTKFRTTWAGIKSAVGGAWNSLKPVFDAIKSFGNWLSGRVFSFKINLPSIPSWATPGSPIPLHAAWKDFGSYLKTHEIVPRLELPDMESVMQIMASMPSIQMPTLVMQPAPAGVRTSPVVMPAPAAGGRSLVIYGGVTVEARSATDFWEQMQELME